MLSYDPQTITKVLSSIGELKDLSPAQLDLIANYEVRIWGPEEYIIHEGAGALDQMIIILSGEVRIRKRVRDTKGESYEQLDEIQCPTLVGENSFFTGLKCSAGVYAKGKTAGIILQRQDFVDLIKLDNQSVVSFLRNIASENLHRAESTEVLYMSALQMTLNEASVVKSSHRHTLMKFRGRLEDPDIEVQGLRDLLLETLMFIRELNKALEQFYEFANLRKIRVLSVDDNPMNIPGGHKFYGVFQKIKEELFEAQQIVPLEMIDFTDTLLTAVMPDAEQDTSTVDYAAIVSDTAEAYEEFIRLHKELGFEIDNDTPVR